MPLVKGQKNPHTKREDVLSANEVGMMIEKAVEQQDKALVSFLYLVGCRVHEALRARKEDIWVDEKTLKIRVLASKQSKRDTDRIPFKHVVPISMDSPFVNVLLDYNSTVQPGALLWPFNRFKAWRKIKKLNPNSYCHLFRETRATKLAERGATDFQLRGWFGWEPESKMPGKYTRKSSKIVDDLADKVD